MFTYSLAVILPFRAIIGPAEYRDIAAQIITDPLPFFNLRIIGFLGHIPNTNPA
jgi:hypothetical protein